MQENRELPRWTNRYWSPVAEYRSKRCGKVKFIPNPRTTVKKLEVVKMDKNTAKAKDNKACTVNALAIAARIPWFVASNALRQAGRTPGKGFAIQLAIHMKKIKGFKFTRVNRGKVQIGKFLTAHPIGRYLVTTSKHCMAIEYGKILDWGTKVTPRMWLEDVWTVKIDNREGE